MRLDELTAGIAGGGWDGLEAGAVDISELAYDSRAARPGALFFCVPGFRSDGHDFAPSAVTAGAAALVCERRLELEVPQLIVPSARACMGPIAARLLVGPGL